MPNKVNDAASSLFGVFKEYESVQLIEIADTLSRFYGRYKLNLKEKSQVLNEAVNKLRTKGVNVQV